MWDVIIQFMKEFVNFLPILIPLILIFNLISDLLWRE